MKPRYDIAVIGLGAMGSAARYQFSELPAKWLKGKPTKVLAMISKCDNSK